MSEPRRLESPAFYAVRPGGWRDWWNLLHPPYTAWHLAYVVIGACLAPKVSVSRLLATLIAFFLAVGVAAHALDEWRGRPLGTRISGSVLVGSAVAAIAGALALGVLGVQRVGWGLVPFLVVGPALVAGYNLELFGGRLHGDWVFAASWGAFPVLTAYVGQTGTLRLAPVLAAGAAYGLSAAQRRLSTPARMLRRRALSVEGHIELADGKTTPISQATMLAPLDSALRAMSWAIVFLAAALAVARLGQLSALTADQTASTKGGYVFAVTSRKWDTPAGSKSPWSTAGSRSNPLGHTTVRLSGSTTTCAKKEGSSSGAKTVPWFRPT